MPQVQLYGGHPNAGPGLHRSCMSAALQLVESLSVGGQVVHWNEFLSHCDAALASIGTYAGLLVDRATSVAVAEWSYGHAERVRAEVWLGGKEYGHLSAGWRGMLP